jgi:protease-4
MSMKQTLVVILAALGLLSVVFVVLAVAVVVSSMFASQPVPQRVVLQIDFQRGVVESVPDDPLARFMMQDVLELHDVVAALDRAADDRRVQAVVARVDTAGMGLAHLQEIRDAVLRFRATGRPAYAFAETFGEFGPGNGGYYLATAFERIYLQPSGDVGVTGLIYESPFIRGLLDKLSVTPRIGQRHEYKNAANFYTERGYTEPHREAMEGLMQSQFSQMVRGIAEARELTEARVRALFDRGPYYGQEAVDAGLVDALAYRDEVDAAAREHAGERASTVDVTDYLARAGRPHRRGTTIALIHGDGTLMRGPSGYDPVDGSMTMGSDTITKAFREAIEDRRVKAIVFRVDSPGGSYVASDAIRRETARARARNKPVVVSMGNLAGSGGYFVSLDANKIVAEPGTITASIGVFGGKLLTREFWAKLGVTWDDVYTSEHARIWTSTHDYGAAAWRIQAGLDRIYEDFTQKVAAGRGLPLERVQEIARGRIWSGEDAKRLGLVDELGGLDVALRLAKEAAGLDADAPVRVRRFPPRPSMIELLLLDGQGHRITAAGLRRSVAALQPKLRVLRRMFFDTGSAQIILPEPLPAP